MNEVHLYALILLPALGLHEGEDSGDALLLILVKGLRLRIG